MKMFVQVEDCQNNVVAIVAVEAENNMEAKYKALRALHINDNLYIINKDEAKEVVENNGIIAIDEDGDEIEIEEDCELPDSLTLSIEDDLGLTDIDDENAVNEEIGNYIDSHYPVSADGWEWEVGDDCSEIVVYDIQWNEE